MKASRLLSILMLLQARGRMTRRRTSAPDPIGAQWIPGTQSQSQLGDRGAY